MEKKNTKLKLLQNELLIKIGPSETKSDNFLKKWRAEWVLSLNVSQYNSSLIFYNTKWEEKK